MRDLKTALMFIAIGNRGGADSPSQQLRREARQAEPNSGGYLGMEAELMIAEHDFEDIEAPRKGLVATLLVATTLVWSFTVVSSAAAF